MNKLTATLSVALLALHTFAFFTLSHAQTPAAADIPTFYRLVPGVYVNGWPRFTIHYSKDWVERRPEAMESFRVSAPGPVPHPAFAVAFSSLPVPLDKLADSLLSLNRRRATDVTILSDKPSQLRDGTPAREIEFEMVKGGALFHTMSLTAKKGDLLIITAVESRTGRVGDDLKAILYSRQDQQGKDDPVKVPPDVREFLDKFRNDVVSHDITKIMTYYSDQYLNSGMRKGETERFWRLVLGSAPSFEVGVTDFMPGGDRAYVSGFGINFFGKAPLLETSIIKEDGEWKWYGNQRDPAP
jgi:hypothetical protein